MKKTKVLWTDWILQLQKLKFYLSKVVQRKQLLRICMSIEVFTLLYLDLNAHISHSFLIIIIFWCYHSHNIHSYIDSALLSFLRDTFPGSPWPILKTEHFNGHICYCISSPCKFSFCCFSWIDKIFHFHL